ncbi:MAG: ADP-ribosylglycohydrolase family protein [Gammaproteobacteria bacterium]|nr:ADP-ribosylglycohydrolase family protein [Gammaproteobacteria bacterium]
MRTSRSGAIEPLAREHHVRSAKRVSPTNSPTTDETIRDRAAGAFLGLAIGDVPGTTLEFCVRDTMPGVVDTVGGGPFNLLPGCWTDDTSVGLALSESLMACNSLDCRDLMDRFVSWWQHGEYSCTGACFAIGNTARQPLRDTAGPATRLPA